MSKRIAAQDRLHYEVRKVEANWVVTIRKGYRRVHGDLGHKRMPGPSIAQVKLAVSDLYANVVYNDLDSGLSPDTVIGRCRDAVKRKIAGGLSRR